MNTRSDTDTGLFDLVGTADPMRDQRVQANAGLDTESALLRITPRLAPAPAPRRPSHQHRSSIRAATVACALVAVVFGIANITPAGKDSGVTSAQARTILKHIQDDLKFPPHAIYEQQDVQTVTTPDGAKSTSESHQWISTSPPYNMRLIRISNGKLQWEQEFVNHRLDIYDPRTNTIYLAPGVALNQVIDMPQWNSALSEVQSELSGKPQCQACAYPNVTINAHSTLNGKPTIELTSDGGRFNFWISRDTYQPLQSEDRQDPTPHHGIGVGIVRYPIARVLTGPAAAPRLLSLAAQHPGAAVDHNIAHYDVARSRMEPGYRPCPRQPLRQLRPRNGRAC